MRILGSWSCDYIQTSTESNGEKNTTMLVLDGNTYHVIQPRGPSQQLVWLGHAQVFKDLQSSVK